MAHNTAQELFNVNGLVAVVTGGGSGLGLYAARALDANGAKAVYIVGRRKEVLESAARSGVNGTIIPVVGDVTDKSSLLAVAERVRREQGYINLLYANAGVMGPSPRDSLPDTCADPERPTVSELQTALLAPDMEAFTRPFHVNATAVLYATAAFLDLLDAGNKRGDFPQDSQVLVTSSVAGSSRHLAASYAYSASKAAANHLSRMLATSFAKAQLHVRVNVIAPGLYPSEMTQGSVSALGERDARFGGAFADAKAMKPEASPAERTGSEEDFAGVVLFAASKAGAYLNGAMLLTDGGRLSVLPSVA